MHEKIEELGNLVIEQFKVGAVPGAAVPITRLPNFPITQ
jgi:hypothetical protein